MRTKQSSLNLVAIIMVFAFCAVLTGYAASIASFVDGTDADAAALANLSGAADITVSSLANVGFEGGGYITRSEFGHPAPGGDEWLFARANVVLSTPSTSTDYFGFTVTSDTDQRIFLGNLTFDRTLARNEGGDISTKFEVFVSVNGGDFISFGNETMGHIDGTDPVNTFLTPKTQTNDLSAIQSARSVKIRIALGDNSASAGKSSWIQNINLEGSLGQTLSLLARYGEGTFVDEPALLDLMNTTNVTASSLSRVGFSTSLTSITTPNFNSVTTPDTNEWLYANGNYIRGGWINAAAPPSDTISTDDYFGFTVTATGNNFLYLDELRFERMNISEASAIHKIRFEVYVAVDGGAFISYGYDDMSSTGPVYSTPTTDVTDLSAIRAAETVEIRIALGDNSGSSGKAALVKDIRLSGLSRKNLGTLILIN